MIFCLFFNTATAFTLIPFSAFLVIPYALVGRHAKASGHAGKVMATMNLFMCLPELVVSLVLGPIVAATGGSMRVPLLVGALSVGVCVVILTRGFDEGWEGTWERGGGRRRAGGWR